MRAETEIQGDEVVGVPGQALTWRELRVLVGLADGETPNTIAGAINADKAAIRYIESSIKAKLGAKTHPHMIARGFTLGVLFPRALCILLAIICTAQSDLDATRTRSPRNSRAPSTFARLARASAGSRGKSDSANLGGLFS